jgi:predicted 2-oxoglutarate/Fe(II)-dependent dioxygenase YbiX
MNSTLLANNYIILKNFISPERANSLAIEYRKYCKQENTLGDSQAPNSHSNYNYISFLELLCEKTPEVSSLLEETVLPSYAYSRVYKNGNTLEKHVDRDSCEISFTLHLGSDKPWLIWIETPTGEQRSVNLNPGDAMMYLGREAIHWRDSYSGEWFAQIFLHYVRSRGDCSYAYFDKIQKKPEIESPKSNEIKSPGITENKIQTPTLIVPKSHTKLEDFIKVFDDIVPVDLCDKILAEYIDSNEWLDTLVGEGMVNKNIRNCSTISMSDSNVINRNYESRKYIDENIHTSLLKGIDQYKSLFPNLAPDIDTGYELLRYKTGEFYSTHTDSFKQQQRSVSCSISLNDDFVGGEFAFFDREIMIRLMKGSVVMFPSNFMYPHEIMPVIEGTRYSIITWYV